MSRQDKATTERNAKILRDLVKKPENKVCADCKRNDPRWASWNLGVFVCIRCSGIHRGMGTHISKVKSVDLDVWTPEQMQSIQKWGNHRANLYWEAHLKPGHIPADHKMESFIRSKYESRRWALEGPPPSDPAALEGAVQPAASSPPVVAPPSGLKDVLPPPPMQSALKPATHTLLSTSLLAPPKSAALSAVSVPAAPITSTKGAQDAPRTVQSDLFALDFHSPSPAPNPVDMKKDVKSDILSLFGSTPVLAPVAAPGPPAPVSLAGQSGPAMWGVQPNLASVSAGAGQPNVWAHSPQPAVLPQTANMNFGSDIWSASSKQSADPFSSLNGSAGNVQKKDDAFSDLWGDFK